MLVCRRRRPWRRYSGWRPVLEFLSGAIARQTGIRDYIGGEKVVQGLLAAYLSIADYYVFRSEAELGKGHADISLEPLIARYPQLRRGYLIELKYLSRGEAVDSGRVAAAAGAASTQLERYLTDERLARQFPEVRFTGFAVVFHGWEMAFCDRCSRTVARHHRAPRARQLRVKVGDPIGDRVGASYPCAKVRVENDTTR